MAVAKAAAATTGDVVTTPDLSKQEENEKIPNPFVGVTSFFTDLIKNFKLPHLPFLPPNKQQLVDERATATSESGRSESSVVSYPSRDLSSEKLDVVPVRESQPFVVWQGIVIGGVLVLRWAWVMWNRKLRSRKPPNDTPPPTPTPTPTPTPATDN